MRPAHADPYKIPCGYCKAEPFTKCRTHLGHSRSPHEHRKAAARKEARRCK